MRKNSWIALALVVLLPAMLFTVSCAKKQVETAEETAAPMEQAQPDTSAEDAAAEQARLEAERLQAEQEEQQRMAAQDAFLNEDIYFEFDSSALLPMAQDVLAQKAQYMRAMSDMSVTIEGHCDERGTDAYNLALGERRAQSVKDYLVNLGIPASRLDTISYGEERPVDPGHNEEAWAKNRRAHFTLQ